MYVDHVSLVSMGVRSPTSHKKALVLPRSTADSLMVALISSNPDFFIPEGLATNLFHSSMFAVCAHIGLYFYRLRLAMLTVISNIQY